MDLVQIGHAIEQARAAARAADRRHGDRHPISSAAAVRKPADIPITRRQHPTAASGSRSNGRRSAGESYRQRPRNGDGTRYRRGSPVTTVT